MNEDNQVNEDNGPDALTGCIWIIILLVILPMLTARIFGEWCVVISLIDIIIGGYYVLIAEKEERKQFSDKHPVLFTIWGLSMYAGFAGLLIAGMMKNPLKLKGVGLGIVIFLGVIAIPAIFGLLTYDNEEKREEREKQLRLKEKQEEEEKLRISNLINKHFHTLNTKFKQNIYIDDYGNVKIHNAKWVQELRYFVKNVLYPKQNFSEEDLEIKIKRLNNIIIDLRSKKNTELTFDKSNIQTGQDYERYVESILKNNNYTVKQTPTTSDYGVDLVVETPHASIAIQCKYYSKPVGNKAVQEVASGRQYYDCDYAMVVSNQGYTLNARKLAQSLNVFLTNDSNLINVINALK